MIRLIEALEYRCLQHVRQPLGPFHVLVGPNASGKSTFLDVLGFLRDLIAESLEPAIRNRTANFHDLVWGRKGREVELAVEAEFPEGKRPRYESGVYDTIRYWVAVGMDLRAQMLRILDEQVWLKDTNAGAPEGEAADDFPGIAGPGPCRRARGLFCPVPAGQEYIGVREEQPEAQAGGTLGSPRITRIARRQKWSTLRFLDELGSPAATWLRELLTQSVSCIDLDSRTLRDPSPPGALGIPGEIAGLGSKGENLPWLVASLKEDSPDRFAEWISHVRTALPDLADVHVLERPEDKHRYLMVEYRGGLEVPSWMLSDGTLRLLALTYLAYGPAKGSVYLIEEPEDRVHPLSTETIMQSLQSVYDGQVLVTTHSPLVLSVVKPEDVLVFSRDEQRGTQIVAGNDHPGLRDWRGEVSLGTLFAGGVLG